MKAKYFLFLVGILLASPALAQTFDGARVYRTSNQSIPHNTATAVGFTSESYDTSTYHDNAVNITRLSVSATGYYQLIANVYFEAHATGLRAIQIRRNGVTIIGYCTWEPEATNSIQLAQCVANWYEGSPSAYYEVFVYQSSAIARDIVADAGTGEGTTWFSIQFLGN